MKEDIFKRLPGRQLDKGIEVLKIGMDSGGANQAQIVKIGIIFLGVFDCRQKGSVFEKRAVGNGHVDSGQVLIDNSAGPQVEVPRFGIACLTPGQTNRFSRGGQLGVGE